MPAVLLIFLVNPIVCVLEPIHGYSSRGSGQPVGKRHIQVILKDTTGTEENFTLTVEVVLEAFYFSDPISFYFNFGFMAAQVPSNT